MTRFTIARWIAWSMAAVGAWIHAVLVPSHLHEQFYIGFLFIVAVALLGVVLISLLIERVRLLGWVLGVFVNAGMGVGFVLSRTIGLPGYHETWTSDGELGLVSLAAEVVFIACASICVRLHRAPREARFPIEVHDAEALAKQWILEAGMHPQRSPQTASSAQHSKETSNERRRQ